MGVEKEKGEVGQVGFLDRQKKKKKRKLRFFLEKRQRKRKRLFRRGKCD